MNPQTVRDYDDAVTAVASRFQDPRVASVFTMALDDIFFDFRDCHAWRILVRWGARRPA